MNEGISVVRSPELGTYIIVDSRGIPRTVTNWEDAANVLKAIAMEDNTEIDLARVEIDAGVTKRFRCRESAW